MVPSAITFFAGLDRLGPGSAESLRWAMEKAGLPPDGRVLDAGCGTGADLGTLLAGVPKGSVIAIDAEETFVDLVRERHSRVVAYTGDFCDPPDGPFHFIWSGGAIYNRGVATVLACWRRHLMPGGCVAFSDLRWRTEFPPEEAVEFWKSEGVEVSGVAQLEAEVSEAGYRILVSRWLGTPGWASYYGPLEAELDGFEGDPDFVEHLRREIALWRTHGVSYGYRLVVCQPIDDFQV